MGYIVGLDRGYIVVGTSHLVQGYLLAASPRPYLAAAIGRTIPAAAAAAAAAPTTTATATSTTATAFGTYCSKPCQDAVDVSTVRS
jgi:hypothetical protein